MFDDLALPSTLETRECPDGVRALKLFVRRDQPHVGMLVYETSSNKLLRYDTLETFEPGQDWELRDSQCAETPVRHETKEIPNG